MYPVDYNGVRVLTTEQLAQAYECETVQISQNFLNNKDHFKEGKHFFKLEGNALKNLRLENIELQISPKARCLYLWPAAAQVVTARCSAQRRRGRCTTTLKRTTSTRRRRR